MPTCIVYDQVNDQACEQVTDKKHNNDNMITTRQQNARIEWMLAYYISIHSVIFWNNCCSYLSKLSFI